MSTRFSKLGSTLGLISDRLCFKCYNSVTVKTVARTILVNHSAYMLRANSFYSGVNIYIYDLATGNICFVFIQNSCTDILFGR